MEDVDIVQIIKDAGIEVSEHGSVLRACCSFHRTSQGLPEKTPSLTIYPETNSFYCFGCGIGGDAVSFIMNFYAMDYKSALDYLGLKDKIYDTDKIKNKLQAAVQHQDSFLAVWIYANKILRMKNLSLSPEAKQIDKTLDLPESQRTPIIRSILESILK